MKKIMQDELNVILEKHKKWLHNEEGGERANLTRADLTRANLRWANLTEANLTEADLRWANLRWANLTEANLTEADLRWADLTEANLTRANLRWAIGNNKEAKSLQIEKYSITFTADKMAIGCEFHTIEEWRNFEDDQINHMDSGALEWWNKYKAVIFELIRLSAEQLQQGKS